jgi:hypothetical protein
MPDRTEVRRGGGGLTWKGPGGCRGRSHRQGRYASLRDQACGLALEQ